MTYRGHVRERPRKFRLLPFPEAIAALEGAIADMESQHGVNSPYALRYREIAEAEIARLRARGGAKS